MATPYWKRLTAGDLQASCALMLDSMVNLGVLSSILISFGFPADVILFKMIPGSALGVLFGNLAYTVLALRLAHRKGRDDITAMPLGLDTPSTIGMAMAVLGPAFVAHRTDLLAHGVPANIAVSRAAETAWAIGMAMLILMGVIKLLCSQIGDWAREQVPQAGLLGSVGGIGLALLSFIPLLQIFRVPEVGLVSLGICVTTLVAQVQLPWRLPGAAIAVLAGTALFYTLGPLGLLPPDAFRWPTAGIHPSFPRFSLAGVYALQDALHYLPLALPFAFLTIVGGINAGASAYATGDKYATRQILLWEALATLGAGFFGGVIQSTPYIGHPAYKRMGARYGYTLIAGLGVGVGGMLGVLSFIVEALPLAAISPVMVFVGFEIVTQAFFSCPRRHAPAVVAAFLPAIASLLLIRQEGMLARLHAGLIAVGGSLGEHAKTVEHVMQEAQTHQEAMTIVGLGHGFVLTSMLWGGLVALVIDRRLCAASAFALACACLTSFGIIHSMAPAGDLYWPWNAPSIWPLHWATGYLLLALLFVLLSCVIQRDSSSEALTPCDKIL